MYTFYRKEKIEGGVALWVKDNVVSRVRNDIEKGINVKDSVWMEIRDCRNGKILLSHLWESPRGGSAVLVFLCSNDPNMVN